MSSKYSSGGGCFGNKFDFVLIVVLFILLIIVGTNYSGYCYY
ncbi:YjcZ family sporulation protein [Ureibacillus sp. FSL K6-8385]|uniref:YjcZ family sporulation protein n=1 Tax=Ureibacillus terrenus TaxID=118246 RepID=A0A540V1S0_9BACL|nr:YjcZ family sporulation protein [Ureibacillus terrenus]MED3662052.1 YjcZ family sporulation protein [Ureibacillus terrenus]MED3764669.1 YjcZ family sporulation protein [Ureibacillus terrenus]TQE90676.1 YjcZ family sporulation protein [Ureibacillus terrenus]